MNSKLLLLLLAINLCFSMNANAQDVVSYSVESIGLYNPAYIFQENKYKQAENFGVTFGFQNHAIDFDDAPRTAYAILDLPYYIAKGYFGGYLLIDGIRGYQNIQLGVDYTFPYTDFLAFGLRTGIIARNLNTKRLIFADPSDPLNTSRAKIAPDLGIGFLLNLNSLNFKVNGSLIHINKPNIAFEEFSKEHLDRLYWINTHWDPGSFEITLWGCRQNKFYNFAFGVGTDLKFLQPKISLDKEQRLTSSFSIIIKTLSVEILYSTDLKQELTSIGDTLEFVLSIHNRGLFKGIPCPR